ncbi:MAG: hypothetical protein IIC91_01860 [Chloroflexi bacterium]|nr:hypothetical protein [Chloroflexota bacterium]
MSGLPPGATAASQVRLELAREIAGACPPELGREIALTGSVARGVADDASDIELNFWTDEIPSGNEREAWLREMGGDPLVVDATPGADGTRWVICFVRGIQIEAGWQSIERQRDLVRQLAAGEILDHQRLIVADTLRTGVPLRTDGLLAEWQAALAEYPSALGERLIEESVERWSWPPFHWALAERGEWLAVSGRLVGDVGAVLRILCALNERWEPDWKWLRRRTQDFEVVPDRLAERIDAIFSSSDPQRAVEQCLELILDTLRLLPPRPDATHAIAIVEEYLARRPA